MHNMQDKYTALMTVTVGCMCFRKYLNIMCIYVKYLPMSYHLKVSKHEIFASVFSYDFKPYRALK
jgi:hypothetical protein